MKITVSIGKEIEILKEELRFERRKLARLQRQSAPNGVNGNTSYIDADAIKSDHHKEAMTEIQQIYKCEILINALETEISECEAQLKKLYDRVLSLESTDEKVVIFRDVYGEKLQDIADELGYSLSYIKKISMRNPKREPEREPTS